MKRQILARDFFVRPTLEVARNLVGCFLVREIQGVEQRARIVETEAYIGEDDLACHASKGRTKRTEVMYGEAGHAYVYLVYGMHELLNIVTEDEGFPAAVLIRAVELEGVPFSKTNGPGKLTRVMQIDRALNGADVTNQNELWFEKGEPVPETAIEKTPRVGIAYAEHCAAYPWRFVVKKPVKKG